MVNEGFFGDLVRERRRELGLSLTELTRTVMLDASQLSRMERGLNKPPELVPYVAQWAHGLEWTFDFGAYRRMLFSAISGRFGAPGSQASEDAVNSLGEMAQLVGEPKLAQDYPFDAQVSPVASRRSIVRCQTVEEAVGRAAKSAFDTRAVRIETTDAAGRTTVFKVSRAARQPD